MESWNNTPRQPPEGKNGWSKNHRTLSGNINSSHRSMLLCPHHHVNLRLVLPLCFFLALSSYSWENMGSWYFCYWARKEETWELLSPSASLFPSQKTVSPKLKAPDLAATPWSLGSVCRTWKIAGSCGWIGSLGAGAPWSPHHMPLCLCDSLTALR